jgi:hypothetical protein
MRRDPVYRQDAPGYLGMVRETEGLRVIVADSNRGAARYYRLQIKAPGPGWDAPGWVAVDGSSSATLAKLLHKCAASCPGLRELVEGLPEDPAKAAPWLWPILAARDDALSSPLVTHLKPPLV